ncbi:hypothetical protein N9F31_00235 [Pseudomonadales bacterium]|nr:hypothetical protein [Pseudomonadales bacterium]
MNDSRGSMVPTANLKFVFAIVITIAFYSFGTFGFFNLFGIATGVKAFVVFYMIIGLICFQGLSLGSSGRWPLALISLIFFGYYGFFLTLSAGSVLNGIVSSAVMWIMFVYLIYVEKKYIIMISKSVVVISAIFSAMGLFVFVAYSVPGNMDPNSIHLFDSDTGNKKVSAVSIYDYFSFTSGDGYEVFGRMFTRVKGFSNEPSSALVHYLAPVVLAFFLGKNYKVLGWILLVFMLFAVASLVGIIVIIFSFFAYIILRSPSRSFQNAVFSLGLVSTLTMLTYGDTLVSIILTGGQDLYASTGYDLLARKEGSANVRLSGFSSSISTIVAYPLGGSGKETLSGLLLQLGLVGGVPVIIAASMCLSRLLKKVRLYFDSTHTKSGQYAASLLLSMAFIVSLMAGYGWDRVSGLIVILLMYRGLDVLQFKAER